MPNVIVVPEVVEVEVESQSERWDFPVYAERMVNPRKSDVATPFVGIFHGETHVCLGSYKGEKLVPNAALIEKFENALNKLGISYTRKITVTAGGARMFARYDLNFDFAGPDGKPLRLRVTVTNSYNGSLRVAALIEALRLICLNGCVGFGRSFEMVRKHSENLDTEFIAKSLEQGITNASESFDVLKRLTEINVTPEQGLFALRNLSSFAPHKFSVRMGERVAQNWLISTPDEKEQGDTLWRMYNAGTRLFRDLETEKLELSRKTNEHFTLALTSSATNPAMLAKLLTPVNLSLN